MRCPKSVIRLHPPMTTVPSGCGPALCRAAPNLKSSNFYFSALIKATASWQPGEPFRSVEAPPPLVSGVRVCGANASGWFGEKPKWAGPEHQPAVPVPDSEGCRLLPPAACEDFCFLWKNINAFKLFPSTPELRNLTGIGLLGLSQFIAAHLRFE